VDNSAHFRVCLHSTLWFDVYLRQKPVEEAVKIARKYVTDTKLEIPLEEDGLFVVVHNQLEKDLAFTPCRHATNYIASNCGIYELL